MTTTHICESCANPIPAGLATVRTTLGRDGLVSLAWCRSCRPVVLPAQRISSDQKVAR